MYVDQDGEIAWFVPIIIGAVIGGTSGYIMGNATGAKGWDMVGYIAGGTLIGGLSGGAATGVSALGGAAWWAGAAAGTVGGAGFNGLATGWNGEAMLKGAGIGALSGFVGGGIASAIGGGWGAFAGGAGSSGLGTALSGGSGQDILISSLAGGILSYGIYELTSYVGWKHGGGNNIGGKDISYKQFKAMNTAYQRSRFWRREFGVYMNNDGSAKITPWKDTHKFSVNFRSSQGNIYKTMHAHWTAEGEDWAMLPNGQYTKYDPAATYPNGTTVSTTVGGYHSPQDMQHLLGLSIVMGRTSSTYLHNNMTGWSYIRPNPFVQFFYFHG
jgi:hypothetical protein